MSSLRSHLTHLSMLAVAALFSAGAAVGADDLMIWVYGYAMAWFFLFCWPLSRLIGSLRRRMQGRHAAASA